MSSYETYSTKELIAIADNHIKQKAYHLANNVLAAARRRANPLSLKLHVFDLTVGLFDAMGRIEEAIRFGKELISLNPSRTKSYTRLIDALESSEQPAYMAKIEPLFARALQKINPKDQDYKSFLKRRNQFIRNNPGRSRMSPVNMFDLLPIELLLEILSYLTTQEKVKLTAVCREWRQALTTQTPIVWREIAFDCNYYKKIPVRALKNLIRWGSHSLRVAHLGAFADLGLLINMFRCCKQLHTFSLNIHPTLLNELHVDRALMRNIAAAAHLTPDELVEAFVNLGSGKSSLRNISLVNIDSWLLEQILGELPDLHSFQVHNCVENDQNRLRRRMFSGNGSDDDGSWPLFQNMHTLALSNDFPVKSFRFSAYFELDRAIFKCLPNLRQLSLSWIGLDGGLPNFNREMPHLESLQLSSVCALWPLSSDRSFRTEVPTLSTSTLRVLRLNYSSWLDDASAQPRLMGFQLLGNPCPHQELELQLHTQSQPLRNELPFCFFSNYNDIHYTNIAGLPLLNLCELRLDLAPWGPKYAECLLSGWCLLNNHLCPRPREHAFALTDLHDTDGNLVSRRHPMARVPVGSWSTDGVREKSIRQGYQTFKPCSKDRGDYIGWDWVEVSMVQKLTIITQSWRIYRAFPQGLVNLVLPNLVLPMDCNYAEFMTHPRLARLQTLILVCHEIDDWVLKELAQIQRDSNGMNITTHSTDNSSSGSDSIGSGVGGATITNTHATTDGQQPVVGGNYLRRLAIYDAAITGIGLKEIILANPTSLRQIMLCNCEWVGADVIAWARVRGINVRAIRKATLAADVNHDPFEDNY